MTGRRLRVVLALLATLLAPAVAGAQPAAKPARVGLIAYGASRADIAGPQPANPVIAAFVAGLRDRGWVEGRNLVLERRSVEGQAGRVTGLVAELLGLEVDVLVTSGNVVARGARQATTRVPIVMAAVVSPVENGLVQSLARPGGNVTGLTLDPGPEIGAKRLELLKQAMPTVGRVAYLASAAAWDNDLGRSMRAAAPGLGLVLVHADDRGGRYADAFTAMVRERVDAIVVSESAPHFTNRRTIVELAARHRLPAMYPYREQAVDGGLISYGADLTEVFRRGAGYVDRILRGARPGDLPVEQPTRYELVVNLVAARRIGRTLPAALVARADQVVE